MSGNEKSEDQNLKARARLAFERDEFDVARTLYREQGASISPEDLNRLTSSDRNAMRLHLWRIWRKTSHWHVGCVLAERLPAEEAARLYSEILQGELPEAERWRVQCRRINLALTKGAFEPGLVEDYVSAWRYVENLGQGGRELRKGMARMIARAEHEHALQFLDELGKHPEVAPELVEVIELKKRLLVLASDIE